MELGLYPNPAIDRFKLTVTARRDEAVNISILDNLGRPIFAERVSLHRGYNEYEYPLDPNLTSGIYLVTVESVRGKGSLRLVKK